jgi:hypothetical protein
MSIIKASENTHWYYKDGRPCHEQPNKSKGGMRPTNLKDAKKLDLVPSVSVIGDLLAKPRLEIWKQNQILEAAATSPFKREDLSLEAWMYLVAEEAKKEAEIAAIKGTAKHAIIEERFLNWDNPNYICEDVGLIEKVRAILAKFHVGVEDIEPEKSFATEYFGGKMDLPALSRNIIFDIKTKEFHVDLEGNTIQKGKKQKLYWPNNLLQLAGYALGNDLVNPRLVNIYVSRNTDDVVYHEWLTKDIEYATIEFKMLVKLWWIRNMKKEINI